MALLQSGVDIAVIALWLGHESIETTNVYVHANLAMKEKALAKVAPIGRRFRRFRANDHLLAFLESLRLRRGAHSDAPPLLHAAHVAQ
jgi:integrase/recombinase XerD